MSYIEINIYDRQIEHGQAENIYTHIYIYMRERFPKNHHSFA